MLCERKRQQCARHYARIMEALGINLKSEHCKDTPMRVIKMLEEQTAGLHGDPVINLPMFANTGDQLVVVAPIPFASLCSHHHAPFLGHAAVGYLPDKHITGISKFKRVIDHFSARPQTQEGLVNEVADFLSGKLKPKALFVYMDATHTCMGARGVKTPCSSTVTHAVRGPAALDHVKSEFLQLIINKMPRV